MLADRLDGLASQLQHDFIEVILQVLLTQGHGHEVALCVLEMKGTIEHRRQILQLYLSKAESAETGQDEWYLKLLVNVLSYEPTDEFVEVISDFFLTRPHGQALIAPSSILLRTHPNLYLRGWTRLFSETPYDRWSNNLISQGFFWEPDALKALKEYMVSHAPEAWANLRRALLNWADKKGGASQAQKDEVVKIVA